MAEPITSKEWLDTKPICDVGAVNRAETSEIRRNRPPVVDPRKVVLELHGSHGLAARLAPAQAHRNLGIGIESPPFLDLLKIPNLVNVPFLPKL